MAKLNREWKVPPHGNLAEVAEGILTVEGTIAMPLGQFPRRMTVVAVAGGGSAVWSAMALREPEMARIEALGPVRFLIVPNRVHRLDVPAWHARYPDARVIAPPGAREAAAEAAPVAATDDIVGDPTVEFGMVAGIKLDEFALTVRRGDGATLILNDVLSNVRHPKGIGAYVMARLFGFGVDRPRTSRTVRSMFVSDRAALARQFREWAAIPGLRRVIVSHGEVIDRDAAAALDRAAADFES